MTLYRCWSDFRFIIHQSSLLKVNKLVLAELQFSTDAKYVLLYAHCQVLIMLHYTIL